MARRAAGQQLDLVQRGEEPTDWKPMSTIGPGTAEIRIRDESGAFRVVYVTRYRDAVYVLHCFEKKSQKTSRRDLEIATERYRALSRSQRSD